MAIASRSPPARSLVTARQRALTVALTAPSVLWRTHGMPRAPSVRSRQGSRRNLPMVHHITDSHDNACATLRHARATIRPYINGSCIVSSPITVPIAVQSLALLNPPTELLKVALPGLGHHGAGGSGRCGGGRRSGGCRGHLTIAGTSTRAVTVARAVAATRTVTVARAIAPVHPLHPLQQLLRTLHARLHLQHGAL